MIRVRRKQSVELVSLSHGQSSQRPAGQSRPVQSRPEHLILSSLPTRTRRGYALPPSALRHLHRQILPLETPVVISPWFQFDFYSSNFLSSLGYFGWKPPYFWWIRLAEMSSRVGLAEMARRNVMESSIEWTTTKRLKPLVARSIDFLRWGVLIRIGVKQKWGYTGIQIVGFKLMKSVYGCWCCALF